MAGWDSSLLDLLWLRPAFRGWFKAFEHCAWFVSGKKIWPLKAGGILTNSYGVELSDEAQRAKYPTWGGTNFWQRSRLNVLPIQRV